MIVNYFKQSPLHEVMTFEDELLEELSKVYSQQLEELRRLCSSLSDMTTGIEIKMFKKREE
jgi:hypothetical protein